MNRKVLVETLSRLGVPFAILESEDKGSAVVVEDGARVLALYPPGGKSNVFWLHPGLKDCKSRDQIARLGIGGVGGLRLWHSPEIAYMWDGNPEAESFSNYRVQTDTDPGNYVFSKKAARSCVLFGKGRLRDYRTNTEIAFTITRSVEVNALAGLERSYAACGVRLRMQNLLTVEDGLPGSKIDMWHLAQLSTPSILGVTAKPNANVQPVVHGGGGWPEDFNQASDLCTWLAHGTRKVKIGFSADQIRGEILSLTECEDFFKVIIWRMPIFSSDEYVDGVSENGGSGQPVQFWDGFGFCEIEYHSPGASTGSPEVYDVSELIYLEISRTRLQQFLGELGVSRSVPDRSQK